MKKTALMIALTLASGMALAVPPWLPGGGDSGNENSNDNRNYNTNLNSSSSSSQATGVGVGIAGAAAGSVSNSGGNSQSTDVNYNESGEVHYSGKYRVANTPSMGLGGISPTVPCAIPVEGTYSGVGIGVGIGTAYVEDGCVRDRLIKSGLTSGNPDAVRKAAQLLNHDLDAALAKIAPRKSEEPVASGVTSSERDVWAFQNL